jgi:DNA-binding NarL/FixJ family response regulator
MPQSPDLPEALVRLLTPREREVAMHLGTGKANKAVALAMGISLRTVEAHRARIYRKLGVRNALELAFYMCRHGLCPLRLQ